MSKVIPKFWIPKEYPHDMRFLVEGLVEGNNKPLNVTLDWLEGKIVSNKGKSAGNPMDRGTIRNYLGGFYALDLVKVDGALYSQREPAEKASILAKSTVEATKNLHCLLSAASDESFDEQFTQICYQNSKIVQIYNADRKILTEKYELGNKPSPSLLQKLLCEHCNYTFVGHPGVGYLDRFYFDKMEIDTYLKLMNFIVENFGEYAKENLGLVPIHEVLKQLNKVSSYAEDEVKKFLVKLRITDRIELRMTKTQLAENLGVELVDIQGIKYGFLKIKDYSLVTG